MNTLDPIPLLVAHRGYAKYFPENTLPAVEAALQAGASYIEIDIQLSADRVPFLFHDETLERTTGEPGLITALNSQAIASLDAGEHSRLGPRSQATPVPSLADFVSLLQQWPDRRALIEIKQESLDRFGIETTTRIVTEQLAVLGSQAIIISYNEQCIRLVREQTDLAIGWILHTYDQPSRLIANALQPEYLICNHQKTGTDPLWPGPWHWALYEVTDPALVRQLIRRGADLIETMAIGELRQQLLDDRTA